VIFGAAAAILGDNDGQYLLDGKFRTKSTRQQASRKERLNRSP